MQDTQMQPAQLPPTRSQTTIGAPRRFTGLAKATSIVFASQITLVAIHFITLGDINRLGAAGLLVIPLQLLGMLYLFLTLIAVPTLAICAIYVDKERLSTTGAIAVWTAFLANALALIIYTLSLAIFF